MNQMHKKDHSEVDSVGFSINSVGSEREERETTFCYYNPHGMAVGMEEENKQDNTEQYEEQNSSKGATTLDTT